MNTVCPVASLPFFLLFMCVCGRMPTTPHHGAFTTPHLPLQSPPSSPRHPRCLLPHLLFSPLSQHKTKLGVLTASNIVFIVSSHTHTHAGAEADFQWWCWCSLELFFYEDLQWEKQKWIFRSINFHLSSSSRLRNVFLTSVWTQI